MRMSCNGCRVLRKGCSDDCSIRPCLQWIKSPESQGNATVFLAKFYGRAGLLNLINPGPEHIRPAIFRSLLYEACGRIVNPIYGSVGLLWSGSWALCQTAVEAVLAGAPITQIASEAAECSHGPPLKAYDIRHVSKEENPNSPGSGDVHRIRNRCRFKRSGARPMAVRVVPDEAGRDKSTTSHESSLSHQSAAEGESREAESLGSFKAEPGCEAEVELELTLGLEPVSRSRSVSPKKKTSLSCSPSDDGTCTMELGLDYQV